MGTYTTDQHDFNILRYLVIFALVICLFTFLNFHQNSITWFSIQVIQIQMTFHLLTTTNCFFNFKSTKCVTTLHSEYYETGKPCSLGKTVLHFQQDIFRTPEDNPHHNSWSPSRVIKPYCDGITPSTNNGVIHVGPLTHPKWFKSIATV